MPGLVSGEPARKRKRNTDSDDRAAKKAATTSDVNFSIVHDDGEVCPVVASSPGLSLPKDTPLEAYKKQVGTAPYELLLHSSSHRRLDFEAHQDGSGPNSHLQHYVGLYDPKTGSLRLVEARHVTLRSSLRPESLPEGEEEDVARTRAARKLDLTTTFGTKKAKKAVSSLTTNAIAPAKAGDATEAALLDSVAASAEHAPSLELLQSTVDEAKPRPKAHVHAGDVRQVYPLASLIGSDEMRIVPVRDWIAMTTKKEPVQVHSRFVANRLRRVCEASASNDPVAQEKVVALRYLYILSELYASGKPTRGGGKRLPKREVLQKSLGIEDRLLSSVMRRFGGGGELTKWKLDFLITHICALALIVDDFRLDTNDIRQDLGLKDREMLQYFREIGCVITAPTEADLKKAKASGKDAAAAAAQHRIARLRLPLVFPRQRVIVQKKR